MTNPFKYTRQLEEAGFSREQAEIQLQIMGEYFKEDLVTKQDLKVSVQHLETEMNSRFQGLESKLNEKIQNLDSKMQQLEYRLTIKVGTLLIIGFTTMLTFMKIWVR